MDYQLRLEKTVDSTIQKLYDNDYLFVYNNEFEAVKTRPSFKKRRQGQREN